MAPKTYPPGVQVRLSNTNSDPEVGSSLGYDVRLALATEKSEEEMTFGQALKTDRRLIWYSLGFSGTIIMEGYGLALINYFFSYPVFQQQFGEPSLAKPGSFEVRLAEIS